MPGFDRTDPRGMGPMTGGGRGLCNARIVEVGYRGFGMGFRGNSPPWPYVGRGRGGYARCRYPGFISAPDYLYTGRYQEIDELKNQAQAMREQLSQVEDRIKQMNSES